jgi:hypothetical protein
LTVDNARRLRRLYDIEAAALATAAVLLDCPAPDVLAAARIHVAEDACSVATAQGAVLAVPEYAQALLRGWAGQHLLPREWAHDVTTTYLTLRFEAAERHTGMRRGSWTPTFRNCHAWPGMTVATPERRNWPG